MLRSNYKNETCNYYILDEQITGILKIIADLENQQVLQDVIICRIYSKPFHSRDMGCVR